MTTCDKCGYNPDKLTEYMKTVIPKSKIEARIKAIEEYPLEEKKDKAILEELKGLLAND